MRARFSFWASVMVFSLILTGLCMRALALQGVSSADSMTLRGVSCLIIVVLFAHAQKLTLKPKALKTQVFRALLAGLALSFFTMSYNWLTASAVSVLSNADVPLLIVLGPLVGIQATRSVRAIALFSILFLAWYVASLEAQPHLNLGLATLAVGSFLLCFGYLFIKKSMSEENEAVTILVPALAIIFYGLLERFALNSSSPALTPQTGVEALFSGLGMFGAYYSTMRLYSITDIATAEFPTLFSSILIQPLETIFLDSSLRLPYLLSSIGFVVVTYFVVRLQNDGSAASRSVA